MTTLASDIGAADTDIAISGDATQAWPGQTFYMERELIELLDYEDVPPLVGQTRAVGHDRNSWIVRRGAFGTTAVAHSAGISVVAARPAYSASADLSTPDPVASGTSSHPDLAAHDALGLATDAELGDHNHDGTYSALGHTHASSGFQFPIGALYLTTDPTDPASVLGYGTWSQVSQGLFLVGQDGATYAAAAATGGAATHAHVVTQPADHAALSHAGATVGNHAFTQPSAHSDHAALAHSAHAGAAVANHVVTQASGHSAHVVTQPANHVVTQPSGHSNHVTTQPSAHADVLNHVHVQNLQGGTTGTTTGTHFMGSASTGGSLRAGGQSTANPTAGGVASQAHSGAAVDAHSAHAGAAVDAHSGTAVDAHSAHSGGAVDAHGVTQASAHSDHGTQSHSAHVGGAVDAHTVGQASQHGVQSHSGAAVASGSSIPPYFVAYIWQRTA